MTLSGTFKKLTQGRFPLLVNIEILVVDKDFHQEQLEKSVLKKQHFPLMVFVDSSVAWGKNLRAKQ